MLNNIAVWQPMELDFGEVKEIEQLTLELEP
jgi:hypothetical protein